MSSETRLKMKTHADHERTEEINWEFRCNLMIKIQGLSKSFRNSQAVSDLSFTVQPGEVLGLLGPNGAGKTTTLRSVAGVLRPNQGSIQIGNHNLAANPVEAKRLLGYLSDQPAFFDNLTCWEHVQFIANVHSVQNFEPKARLLFECFELTEKKKCFRFRTFERHATTSRVDLLSALFASSDPFG